MNVPEEKMKKNEKGHFVFLFIVVEADGGVQYPNPALKKKVILCKLSLCKVTFV